MLSRDLQAACQRGRWSRSTGLVHRPRRCHHRRAPSHVRLAVRAPDVPQAAFTTVTHGQPRSASRAAELKDSGWSSGARVLPKLAVRVRDGIGGGARLDAWPLHLCEQLTDYWRLFFPIQPDGLTHLWRITRWRPGSACGARPCRRTHSWRASFPALVDPRSPGLSG